MKILKIILFFTIHINLYAQNEDVYLYPEKPSEFILGEDSITNFIDTHFNFCKEIEANKSIIVKFIVERDGRSSNIVFITNHDELLKEKVINLFEKLPEWKPGLVNNKPVRSYRMLHLVCKDGILYKYPKQ